LTKKSKGRIIGSCYYGKHRYESDKSERGPQSPENTIACEDIDLFVANNHRMCINTPGRTLDPTVETVLYTTSYRKFSSEHLFTCIQVKQRQRSITCTRDYFLR